MRIGQASEHVGEPGLRVDIVEFGGGDQRCKHAALAGKLEPSSGAGAKKARFCDATVETPAARRRRSFLRLPRRAFIGGMRYGEGRLHTKDAGDALR